ncbi:hypothetical protein TcBrA4_0080750 [Trypanosoma cruzi]|nr:hypothetical protein TcBrA4_0080750 [Trypanosoma cruzi]
MIKQEDQRRFTSPDEQLQYLQCGVVLVQNTSANAIPTHNVTGNNHKPIYKSLFLNSREVANAVTVPPNSLCYLVPSCMSKDPNQNSPLPCIAWLGRIQQSHDQKA